MPVFKTGAINHSATSPELPQFYYRVPLSLLRSAGASLVSKYLHQPRGAVPGLSRPTVSTAHRFPSTAKESLSIWGLVSPVDRISVCPVPRADARDSGNPGLPFVVPYHWPARNLRGSQGEAVSFAWLQRRTGTTRIRKPSRCMSPSPLFTLSRSDRQESCWLPLFSGGPWPWRNLSSGCGR